MKKYEFTGEIKIIGEVTLLRIKAKIDFGSVKAGEIGGWIEKETNLSHDGNAWVSSNTMVSGGAEVYGNAVVYGDARVSSDAEVYGNAEISNLRHFFVLAIWGAKVAR